MITWSKHYMNKRSYRPLHLDTLSCSLLYFISLSIMTIYYCNYMWKIIKGFELELNKKVAFLVSFSICTFLQCRVFTRFYSLKYFKSNFDIYLWPMTLNFLFKTHFLPLSRARLGISDSLILKTSSFFSRFRLQVTFY